MALRGIHFQAPSGCDQNLVPCGRRTEASVSLLAVSCELAASLSPTCHVSEQVTGRLVLMLVISLTSPPPAPLPGARECSLLLRLMCA